MKFAAEGANIAFTDLVLNDDMAAGLEATRKEIEALGVTCRAYAGNAADFEETEKVVKQIPTDNANTFTLSLSGDDERNVTLTALLKEGYYRMNLVDGTATNANGDKITSAKVGDTVKLTAADAPEGMVFDRWEITPTNVELELKGGFEAGSATTSFVMPAQTLTIRAMYRMADVEEPDVLGTVAVVATAGVGAAVLGWTGYQLGTELYLKTALPAGTAIPTNRAELALLVWNHAGKPAPAAVLPADATDTQKAIAWAVENDLLKAAKDNGETYVDTDSVSRVEVIRVWNKAQEK